MEQRTRDGGPEGGRRPRGVEDAAYMELQRIAVGWFKRPEAVAEYEEWRKGRA